MRYDLIILGDTPEARRRALAAADRNELVAVVRTVPVRQRLFSEPLESWDFGPPLNWATLLRQFRDFEYRIADQLAGAGVDLYEGRVRVPAADSVTLFSRSRGLVELRAARIAIATGVRTDVPDWVRAEVPGVLPLNSVPLLDRIPERVLIEGGSTPASRLAVMLSRIDRTVIQICGETGADDEFDGELDELRDEVAHRGGLLLPASEVVTIANHGTGGFQMCLHNRRVLSADMYVFADNLRGNSDGMGLEHLGIVPDERGRIWCDDEGRTWHPSISACGGIVSPVSLRRPGLHTHPAAVGQEEPAAEFTNAVTSSSNGGPLTWANS